MGHGKEQSIIEALTEHIHPNPHQPRIHFDEGEDWKLGRSMIKEGQKWPLRVIKMTNGHYQIVGGERRWRAAKLVGIRSLKVIVEEGELSELELAKDQLIDNLHFRKLNLIELAAGFQTLAKDGMKNNEIAEALDISEGQVSRAFTINSCLLPALQNDVSSGALPAHAAYRIATLPAQQQLEIAEQVKRGELNRHGLEAKIRALQGKSTQRKPKTTKLTIPLPPDAGWDEAEEILKGLLKCIHKCRSGGIPAHLVIATLRAEL